MDRCIGCHSMTEILLTMMSNILQSTNLKAFADGNSNMDQMKKVFFKSSPNDKIWDQSNLEAFADAILNVIQMTICVTVWVESMVGKGENAGYHNVFIRLLFKGR